MADPADLDDDENWKGGFFELAIELGDCDDARLDTALRTAWDAARVDGAYEHGERDRRGRWAHRPVDVSIASLARYGHLRGLVTLPTGERTVFGAVAVREDGGPDWLDLYIPTEALHRLWPSVGAFPFGASAAADWARILSDWYVTIARIVFQAVPFRLGLVGFEVSGMAYADGLEIPEDRYMGYLVPDRGTLTYHAATDVIVATIGAPEHVEN